jgi:ribosomal-protein-alanine N-acetyltransferase
MPGAALRVRPMLLSDLPAVMAVEPLAFAGDAWPESVYRKEILNPASSYWVLEQDRGDSAAITPAAVFLGYGGFWIIDEEAHLMTIAIAPRWQGRGLGEWFLLALFDLMEEQGARACTLEVRVSNLRAQALYRRLGFAVEGKRRRYYSDNGEDALIMTTPPLASPSMVALRSQRQALMRARDGFDLVIDRL